MTATTTPEYLAALEHLLHTTREFLAKRAGIGELRQAMQSATREKQSHDNKFQSKDVDK